MVETSWTEEAAAAPRKKKVPIWLWFCGGGCLLAVLIAVAALVLLVPAVKKAADPEAQWERLARILPYDHRPAELKPQMGFGLGLGASMEQVQLEDSRGFQITVQSHEGASGSQARREMFPAEGAPRFPENVVVMKFKDVESGKVEVQGRELPLLRMRMEFAGWMMKLMPKQAEGELGRMGSMAFIDVTPEGAEGLVLVQVVKLKNPEPVSDEEIRDLLEPFRIGPKR